MSWMPSGIRDGLTRSAIAAAFVGAAMMGAAVAATVAPVGAGVSVPLAVQDPGCEMFGWRHPMCAGGAFDMPTPASEAADGAIPAPAMVPNVDGSLSPPGTPGAV